MEEKNLSVQTILSTPENTLNEWIKKCGFHNKKAKYIKQSAEVLAAQHNGRVPCDYAKLVQLPGVGPKMAHLVL